MLLFMGILLDTFILSYFYSPDTISFFLKPDGRYKGIHFVHDIEGVIGEYKLTYMDISDQSLFAEPQL